MTDIERNDPVADELELAVQDQLEVFDRFAVIAKRHDVMITLTITPFDQRVGAYATDQDDDDD